MGKFSSKIRKKLRNSYDGLHTTPWITSKDDSDVDNNVALVKYHSEDDKTENDIHHINDFIFVNAANDYRDKMDYEDLDNMEIGAAEKAVKYADMGIGCKRRGEYEKSVLCYKKSLELNPKAGMVYYNLGKVLYLTNRYEGAQRAYYMAYIYGIFSSLDTICRHIGHAVLDARANPRYAETIRQYALSIAGKGGFGIDRRYEEKCIIEGKKTLGVLKEKLKVFEASSVK